MYLQKIDPILNRHNPDLGLTHGGFMTFQF
mgnify:CR=1 FL=1